MHGFIICVVRKALPAIVLLGAALAVKPSRAEEPPPQDEDVQEAIYAIRDFSGSVVVEEGVVVAVVLHFDGGREVTDDDLTMLKPLHDLKRLNLHGQPITDDGLAALGGFEDLEKLDLSLTQVRGPGLTLLAALPKLSSLKIGTLDDDFRLIQLTKFPALAELELYSDSVSDAELLHLNGVRRLRSLRLSGRDKITMEGVAALAELPIEVLEIELPRLTDHEVVALSAFHNLRELTLTGGRLTGGCFRHLTELSNLTTLNVDCSASDDDLPPLAALRNLRSLWFGGKQVTVDGLRALQPLEHLESLRIYAEFSRAQQEEIRSIFPRLRELR